MRFWSTIFICALALPTLVFAQSGLRDEVKALLLRTSLQFEASIKDITEPQWNYRASNQKHTIGALAEHAAISANDLQTMVQKALDAGAQPELAETLSGQVAVVRDVMLSVEQPPDNFRPAGRLLTKEDIHEYFPQVKGKALALLAAASDPEIHVYRHPSRRIGNLTAVQWFYYIAYLVQAHTEHIERIKADPGYPNG
jgi:hypothetical protein